MPTTPVTCPKEPLTRDLDVVVNISRPISEVATDMTMICFATPNVTFSDGGNDRVQFFSSFDALASAVLPNSPAYWAGQAFFARSERPTTMCVGRVFTEPTPAVLRGGKLSVSPLKAISDGGFDMIVNGETEHVRGLNFSAANNLSDVASVVNSKLSSVTVSAGDAGLALTTLQTGDGAELSYASTPSEVGYHLSTLSNASTVDVMTALASVSDGSLTVEFDGMQYGVTGMDFTGATTPTEVATLLQNSLRTAGLSSVDAYVSDNTVMLSSQTTVDNTGFAACPVSSTGTDVAALLKLRTADAPTLKTYTEVATAQPAKIVSNATLDYTSIAAKGSATVKLAGKEYTVDFTSVTDAESLVAVFAASSEFAGDYTASTDSGSLVLTGLAAKYVTYMTDELGTLLGLTEAKAVSLQPVYVPAYTVVPATDVSALLGLTEALASNNTIGYTPGDLVSELTLIARAARCAGRAVYGWVLDAMYRDTADQKAVADWAEARKPSYFSACTNSPQAYNTADISNIGYYVSDKGYERTSVIYHNNPQVYPDMSYIALALSVDYAQDDSTLTMKFKQLTGIEPSPISETQLSALESRRINCYVAIGNSSREVREGVQGNSSWFTDSLVNLDNFAEELQVEVYNVFLRNKKVPYTNGGQNLLVSAATKICKRYTSNGTFAPRDVETTGNETGLETLPATDIRPAAVSGATISDRARRLAPPIAVTAYEAGAFHKIVLNVGVYS